MFHSLIVKCFVACKTFSYAYATATHLWYKAAHKERSIDPQYGYSIWFNPQTKKKRSAIRNWIGAFDSSYLVCVVRGWSQLALVSVMTSKCSMKWFVFYHCRLNGGSKKDDAVWCRVLPAPSAFVRHENGPEKAPANDSEENRETGTYLPGSRHGSGCQWGPPSQEWSHPWRFHPS